MDATKSPWGTTIAGAGIAVTSVIFAVPICVMANAARELGLFDMMNYGGSPMYLALLTAMAMAGLQGGLVMASARGNPKIAAFLPLTGALVLAVGVFGFKTGMSGSLAAIVHVAPQDKTTITFAAMSEAMCCLVFGGALAAAVWFGQGLGLGIASLNRDPASRAAMAAPGVVALACGLWALAGAMEAGAAAAVFGAAAHVDPSNVEAVRAEGTAQTARWELLAMALGASGAVGALAALGWAALRARSALVPIAATAALTLLVLLGLHVSQHQTEGDVHQAVAQQEEGTADALVFSGEPSFLPCRVDVNGAGVSLEPETTWEDLIGRARQDSERMRGLHSAAGEQERPYPVMLVARLHKGTTSAVVGGLIEKARAQGFEQLTLIGHPPPPKPQPLPGMLKVLEGAGSRDAFLELGLGGDAKGTARIAEPGVVLEGKTLPFAEWTALDKEPADAVVLEVKDVSPEQLVRGILALRHAGYRAIAGR